MKKNLLIGILIITNIALGIVAYKQKNNAESQQKIADTLRIEVEHQRQMAEHAMEEAMRQRGLASELQKLAKEETERLRSQLKTQ